MQWTRLNKKGILADDLLEHVWNSRGLEVLSYKTELLELMKAFDLLFENPVEVIGYLYFAKSL